MTDTRPSSAQATPLEILRQQVAMIQDLKKSKEVTTAAEKEVHNELKIKTEDLRQKIILDLKLIEALRVQEESLLEEIARRGETRYVLIFYSCQTVK